MILDDDSKTQKQALAILSQLKLHTTWNFAEIPTDMLAKTIFSLFTQIKSVFSFLKKGPKFKEVQEPILKALCKPIQKPVGTTNDVKFAYLGEIITILNMCCPNSDFIDVARQLQIALEKKNPVQSRITKPFKKWLQ